MIKKTLSLLHYKKSIDLITSKSLRTGIAYVPFELFMPEVKSRINGNIKEAKMSFGSTTVYVGPELKRMGMENPARITSRK